MGTGVKYMKKFKGLASVDTVRPAGFVSWQLGNWESHPATETELYPLFKYSGHAILS